MGIICGLGDDLDAVWAGLVEGACAIRPVTVFDTTGYRSRIAAEVPALPAPPGSLRENPRRLSRTDLLSLHAAEAALRHARLIEDDSANLSDVGIFFGAGSGGMRSIEIYRRAVHAHAKSPLPSRRPSPSLLVPYALNTTTDLIAQCWNLGGPRLTVSTVCTSSTNALGLAFRAVREGRANRILAGGGDGLCELTFAGFNSMRAVDGEPCRPFDRNRRGLSLGEGAAFLVVESLESARTRGVEPLAEILGYGHSSEAYHITAPDLTGAEVARTLRLALADAAVAPDEIDHINAHGTATPHNDVAESRGIGLALGDRARQIPICSIKSMVGHCLGAAGAVEAVAAVRTLQTGWVPPTIHHETPDPDCPYDYVPNRPRRSKPRAALSNNFAFGGNNAALVLRRMEGSSVEF
jgi:3-oxoacyl-[acyl-carrier-protein] synthase II